MWPLNVQIRGDPDIKKSTPSNHLRYSLFQIRLVLSWCKNQTIKNKQWEHKNRENSQTKLMQACLVSRRGEGCSSSQGYAALVL
jgi:hypothetical protein